MPLTGVRRHSPGRAAETHGGPRRSRAGPQGGGSRTLPGCWKRTPARPRCRSSSASSHRTPEPSSGSPTSTGAGSPPSLPSPNAGSSLTRSRSTICGPGVRTESGTPMRRAAEPAAEGLRAEPGLAQDRSASPRTAGLDQDTHRRRHRPPAGAKRLRLWLCALLGRVGASGRRLRLRLAGN
jgi:hypothetical protein